MLVLLKDGDAKDFINNIIEKIQSSILWIMN